MGTSAVRDIKPQAAFDNGLVLHSATISDKLTTGLLLLANLEKLVRSVNATRSFQSEEDLMDAVDDIIELFPSLKIEEVLLCFKHIRQGKYELFGNLTTNTLIKCLHKYELDNTIPMREREHTTTRKMSYHTAHIDWSKIADDLGLEQPKKTLDELGGHLHLTEQDLKDIQDGKEGK